MALFRRQWVGFRVLDIAAQPRCTSVVRNPHTSTQTCKNYVNNLDRQNTTPPITAGLDERIIF